MRINGVWRPFLSGEILELQGVDVEQPHADV